MGGYSYGAMVTTLLRPLSELLVPFASPELGCVAAEIRMRAQSLAEQQNHLLFKPRSTGPRAQNLNGSRNRPGALRVGGEEGGRSPRASHDSSVRRSFSLDADDKIRKSINDFMTKRRVQHGRRSDGQCGHPEEASVNPTTGYTSNERVGQSDELILPPIVDLVQPRPAYLLISPLQGLVTHLATMSLISFWHKPHDNAAEQKLILFPTLAVFGDQDVFVSVGKLRSWTKKLSGVNRSLFVGHEVAGAGHFWAEEGALCIMVEKVGAFAEGLMRGCVEVD
ncbi:hypothetical protein AAL_03891 [Moelleriella libera RCEF 2490]|uniref:Uncharacterized protein n=1 Tax=Moelleriella libera RCEF 2490 TaxID=1081109 RepID=A0A162INV1_9HYPO|nr:hypothetical protein AAL_03891 [Moelleriella libera RCEF 2490]